MWRPGGHRDPTHPQPVCRCLCLNGTSPTSLAPYKPPDRTGLGTPRPGTVQSRPRRTGAPGSSREQTACAGATAKFSVRNCTRGFLPTPRSPAQARSPLSRLPCPKQAVVLGQWAVKGSRHSPFSRPREARGLRREPSPVGPRLSRVEECVCAPRTADCGPGAPAGGHSPREPSSGCWGRPLPTYGRHGWAAAVFIPGLRHEPPA